MRHVQGIVAVENGAKWLRQRFTENGFADIGSSNERLHSIVATTPFAWNPDDS